MTIAPIPESIVTHEKMFRHQIRVLLLKTLLSKSIDDQEGYRANLIALLDHAYTELMRMAEAVKTYPPSEAMENLEAADNLRRLIAILNVRLEELNYLESDQVYAAVRRTIHGVLKFSGNMRDQAFSDRKKKRAPDEFAAAPGKKPETAIIRALFSDQSA